MMKPLFVFSTLLLAASFAQAAGSLDVLTAMHEAQSANPDLQRLQATAERISWTKTEALSAYLPHLSADYDHSFDMKYMYENVVLGGATLNFPAGMPRDTFNLNVSITVFDGLRGVHAYKAAALNTEAAELDVRRAKFKLEMGVRTAFFKALAAQRLLEVAQADVKTLEDHLHTADITERSGYGTRFDVLRIDANRRKKPMMTMISENVLGDIVMDKPLSRRSKQKPDADRRRELADFLRTRRERIKPEALGTGRRRTPGLRREEVAEQAGVGVSWYTWLEQGRDIQPSIELLRSLSKVLQLSAFESRYLFQLAGRPLPDESEEHIVEVPESARRFVMEVLQVPAYIIDDRFTFLMANDFFTKSFYSIEDMPEEDRNWLHFVFMSPKFKTINPDWETAAQRALAEFRLSIGKQVTSVWAKDLVKRLSAASPHFAQWWKAHDVLERRTLTTQVPVGPEGNLKYERSCYIPLDAENLRINILTPQKV